MSRETPLLDQGTARAGIRNGRLPWFATGLSLPLFSIAFLAPDAGYEQALRLDRTLTEIKPVFTLPLLFNSSDLLSAGGFGDPEAAAPADSGMKLTIRRGDTLDRLFRRHGLDPADLAAIMSLPVARDHLRILKPGDEITVSHEGSRTFGLSRRIDPFRTLNVSRASGSFAADIATLDYETHANRASGEIRSSLFEAGAQAGISEGTIIELASIFASDIDFVLDLREGDRFTVIHEEMWHEGEKLAQGAILAAEFVNQGRTHRAIRYQTRDGRVNYYTPEGKSLRKAFVRTPLAFTRVSSEFNPRRRHPILNTIRAHTGVDYAAPTGTPVRAPGDGKVVFSGRKGGYGNAIILQHAGGVTTLYGHLSRFAKTARVGRRVDQGDVIGFVGATGLATAPHLHYEYRINGRHMNPRTVKLPDVATPIEAGERQHFLQAAAPLIQRLDAGTSLLAAGKDTSTRTRS